MPPRKTAKKRASKRKIVRRKGEEPTQAEKNEKNDKPIQDKKKYKQFDEVLSDAIKVDNYFKAYKILNDAKDFVAGNLLTEKSYLKLNVRFNKKLKEKLSTLGFVDVSGKVLSTTFWAMVSSGNLALKGPPGVGKSFFSKVVLPNLWMDKGDKPQVLVIQPDRNMDIASLVADRGIKKGDTVVEEGQIADAVNLANKGRNVILVLEEINQWPPKVLKDLNDFLEERKLERKIAGKFIKLECPKDRLFIIANYNPEGYTLGEDDTGSVSSRFIFCDLPFPAKDDLQKIIEVNIEDREFNQTSIGDEVKRRPTKPFLRSMGDICYSLRSSIDAGELGPLAMPVGTRTIINFSKALINNNIISDAITKSLVDPILEKYVREGPLTNVEPDGYEEYVRTVFKAVKQILGTVDPVNEKDIRSLKKGLNITVTNLFKFQGKKPYEITIRKATKPIKKSVMIEPLRSLTSDSISEQIESIEEPETPLVIKEPKIPDTKIEAVETVKPAEPAPKPQEKPKPEKKIVRAAKKKKMIPELQCLNCGSSMSMAKDTRGKRNLICNNSNCRNILPIPQYGEIKIFPKKCKICSSIVLQITRRNGKIIHICPVCWRNPSVNGPCETCQKFSSCVK